MYFRRSLALEGILHEIPGDPNPEAIPEGGKVEFRPTYSSIDKNAGSKGLYRNPRSNGCGLGIISISGM